MGVFYGLCAECVELRYMEGKEKMSLRVWLPLTKDLRNQGLDNVTVTNYGATLDNNGKLGKCYYFDGTDDRITVSGLSLPNIWSYSCWIYSAASSSRNWEAVIMLNSTGGDSDLQLGFYTNPNGKVIQNSANGQYNASISWTYGVWHHFCGTFNGSDLKTYIDGILVNTKTITASLLSRTNLTIGARSTNTANTTANTFFQGRLNDVRIYDHCLSPMEVKELSKGLILHYPLNRGGWGQENLIKGSNTNIALNGSDYSSKTTRTYDTTTGVGRIEVISAGSWNAWRFGSSDLSVSTATLSSGTTTYTFSVDIRVTNYSSGDILATFDFRTNNSVHSGVNCTLTAKEKDGSWHRVYGSFTTGGQSDTQCLFCITSNATTGNVGLVVEYKNFKLEEGSVATPWCPNSSDALATTMGLNGTTEYDCSGFCNNGEKIGAVTYTSDTPKYNVATYCPAGTGIFGHPNITFSQFTIAFWGKHSATGKMLMGSNASTSSVNTNWYWYGDNSFKYPGGEFYYSHNAGSADSLLNKWTHFVATYDGANVTVYRNGIYEGVKALTGTQTLEHVSIGNGYSSSSYWENGSVSDLRIYATALSATDVLALYQNSAYIDSSGNVYGAVHTEV